MLEQFYREFYDLLRQEEKEKTVKFAINYIEKITSEKQLVEFYNDVLERSLDEMTCDLNDKKLCIWKEHIRSSIIRTILENAYPKIIELKNKFNPNYVGNVCIICPDGEYHEIGARMVSDFFNLAGYKSIYVGSSIPKEDFVDAINKIRPDIVAISITNYYNIVTAKRMIEALRRKVNYPLKIVSGGNAFENNPLAYKDIGADMLLKTYEEIKSLSGVKLL